VFASKVTALIVHPAICFTSEAIDSQTPVLLSSDLLLPLCFPGQNLRQQQLLQQICCHPRLHEHAPNCLNGFFDAARCCRFSDIGFRQQAESKRRRLLRCESSEGPAKRRPAARLTPYAFSPTTKFGRILWCAATRYNGQHSMCSWVKVAQLGYWRMP